MPEEDEIDYCGGADGSNEVAVISGPNAKNTAKIMCERERKRRQNQYVVTCEFRDRYCRRRRRHVQEYVIIFTPTPAMVAQQEAEDAEFRAAHPVLFREYDPHSWRRKNDVRPKKPRKTPRASLGHKPILTALEALEEELRRPRNRKQGGWGAIYQPTRKRRYARDDLKNWKRHRPFRWRDASVSFRHPSAC